MAMRLGVLMLGTGAHAAACVGVMAELAKRQVEPYAVCGMHAGAWPAALHVAGQDAQAMHASVAQAARMGKRLLQPNVSAGKILRHGRLALTDGMRVQRLLSAQAGQRILALCPRQGLFLCRTARSGHLLIFSTQAYVQQAGAMLNMQASVSFAARAAMAYPPFLPPVEWMGSPLLAEEDAALACRQLLAMGAHRVLVIAPQPSSRRRLDALDLTALSRRWNGEDVMPERTGILRVPMPDDAGALCFGRLSACEEAGRRAAELELDRLFEQMGMAFCRVLPFRRSGMQG